MRTIVVNERTDLRGLRTRLLGERPLAEGALESLARLNPHVNLEQIPAGTVLVVPDLPGLRKEETSSVSGDAFASLREQLLASVDAVGGRVRGGYEELLAQQKEVTAVVRLAAFRRAVEADPDLKEQLETGTQVFKEDREKARAADETLSALKEEAVAELAALAELLK